MLKVLIADDEPKIRKGLREAFQWSDMGMEVVALAEDGVEALNAAKEHHPDVCLIDICMPGLNGLELIERLKNINPYGVNIIVSGHEEFEYAKSAINLGVYDYVLKPVIEEDLKKILIKAADIIEKERIKRKRYEWAEKQLMKNMAVLKDRFMREWLEGSLSKEEIEEQLVFFNIKLSGDIGLLVLNTQTSNQHDNLLSEKQAHVFSFVLQHLLEERLSKFPNKVITSDSQNNILTVVENADFDGLQRISKSIEQEIKDKLQYECRIFCLNAGNIYSELCLYYEEVLKEIDEAADRLPIITKITDYVERHFNEMDLGLNSIAEKYSWSLAHLSRVFKREMGITFMEFLIKVRMREAIKLLTKTDMRIYEIAEKVGYQSQHYFCARFKKIFGIAPTEYRDKAE